MKIYRKDDKIFFEVNAETPRSNPYMSDEDQHLLGTHPTLVGLISFDQWGNQELGWAKVIDDDDFTDYLIHWWGEEEAFRKICGDIGVAIITLPKSNEK